MDFFCFFGFIYLQCTIYCALIGSARFDPHDRLLALSLTTVGYLFPLFLGLWVVRVWANRCMNRLFYILGIHPSIDFQHTREIVRAYSGPTFQISWRISFAGWKLWKSLYSSYGSRIRIPIITKKAVCRRFRRLDRRKLDLTASISNCRVCGGGGPCDK